MKFIVIFIINNNIKGIFFYNNCQRSLEKWEVARNHIFSLNVVFLIKNIFSC